MKLLKFMLSLSILSILSSTVSAESPVYLYYDDRAPYAVTDDQGKVSGLVADPAAEAFELAGIPYKWEKVPFKRQLMTIKYNKKLACGIGWFKNPEREKFARFTDSIYRDLPAITLSKNENSALEQHRDLISLFNDKKLRLLVKEGFSYGAYVDELIREHEPSVVSVANTTNLKMLQMLLAGRADYFFASEEEAEHIILSSGYRISQFQLQHYDDMPAGNYRYIMCSRQVTEEIIGSLNSALK